MYLQQEGELMARRVCPGTEVAAAEAFLGVGRNSVDGGLNRVPATRFRDSKVLDDDIIRIGDSLEGRGVIRGPRRGVFVPAG